MECREYRKQFRAFLEGSLTDRETEQLLKHLSTCGGCMEELRTWYLLIEGMHRLESGGTFDITSDFERMLSMRRKRSAHARQMRMAFYTLLFAAILVSYYFLISGILI